MLDMNLGKRCLLVCSLTLFPDMASLYEAFPDRFMLGMDVAHAPGMFNPAPRCSPLRGESERVSGKVAPVSFARP